MAASIPIERLVPCDDDECPVGWRCDPAGIVELLDDEAAVRLFDAATTPKSVSELADECDLPLSTAYRKVHTLDDVGLFREVQSGSSNGTPPARYERAVDGVRVTLNDGVSVEAVLER